MNRLVAALLVVVLPLQAVADGMTHIPPWTMSGDKACYDFAGAKKLVEIDLQLEGALQELVVMAAINANLKNAAAQLQVALDQQKTTYALLETNDKKLSSDLLSETARANKAEAKSGPSFFVLLGAGVLIALVGAVAGILLGVYVAK